MSFEHIYGFEQMMSDANGLLTVSILEKYYI